ncbi:TTF-type domain-containing protein [Trichonephila clavata]|uniref:TTF-type domain-containing protein n=1 Tax=Trichonephila clavata TaxID=2740835 RepID=A0A8X6LNQ8_TRICU|nr:TTF-type domain-containing protein [Trichonephila clavata]
MLQYDEDSKDSELVVKRVNDTRWYARVGATMAFSKGYISFQKALHVIAKDMTQKLKIIHEAKCLLKDLSKTEKALPSYKLVFKNLLQRTFPNVIATLKIYRCLMITNASGERSFSKLKMLKNCHRFSISKERLNSLAIMAIEYDVLQNIDFPDVLKEFMAKKVRKPNI